MGRTGGRKSGGDGGGGGGRGRQGGRGRKGHGEGQREKGLGVGGLVAEGKLVSTHAEGQGRSR